MNKLVLKYNNLPKNKKLIIISCLFIFTVIVSFCIPTIARRNNRVIINDNIAWDGTYATSYKSGSGTSSDPYIISSANELAYLSEMSKTTNYENTYFKVINDIVINSGIFSYDSVDGIKYTIDNQTYYVDYYSDKYYDNVNRYGTEIDKVNLFNSIDNFKGNIDFGYHTIYGMYITNNQNEEVSLFTNLEGTVKNLYTKNLMIYGGSYTGGIASSINNATLKDIIVDGNVVSNTIGITKTISSDINDLNVELTSINTTGNISLENDIPFTGSDIISTTLKGNYTINGSANTVVKINDIILSSGTFEIDLGNSITKNVTYSIDSNDYENIIVNFANLTYEVVYKYTTTGGVIGYATNSNISNVVNNSNVYGNYNAGGIIGTISNISKLNNSYNTGIVSSNKYAGGIIGTITKNIDGFNLYNAYNIGTITGINGGLIGSIDDNTGLINIYNTFDTQESYVINNISNSNVTINNSYYANSNSNINTGVVTGYFTNTNIDNFKSKDFIENTLLFKEYISSNDLESNIDNVWVYDSDNYPILYIDDIKKPIASIHVSSYLWNNYSDELNTYNFNSNLSFIITDTESETVKEKYYYISNSILTKDELSLKTDWISYDQIVNIKDEGTYIIYAKVVDNNDNIYFINSDKLLLDLSLPSASININDKTYSNLKTDLGFLYSSSPLSINITATDLLSGINSISYYVANNIIDSSSFDEIEWITYSNNIEINNIGKYIIYAKVVDNSKNVVYINSDYIVYDGYKMTLSVGENNSYEDNYNISYNSSIKAIFEHSSDTKTTGIHNLISSILFPVGTKIRLIDNSTKRIYKYEIESSTDNYGYYSSCGIGNCYATYPFSLFTEVGTSTNSSFEEYDVDTEKYTIIVDYSNVLANYNYSNVKMYLEFVKDSEVIIPTLEDIITYNIYSYANYELANASLLLESTYDNSTINLNSDSITDINITTGINYKSIYSNNIIDTTYENKNLGILISLVDSNGNMVSKEYLKNVSFKFNDNIYTFGNDNYVHINLNKGIKKSKDVISIITNSDTILLNSGNYYFRFYVYSSYDANYHDTLSNNYVSIPVSVSKTLNNSLYSFNVTMNNSDKIIYKTNDTYPLTFNIKYEDTLNNPNIKVELYKKTSLSAYNQDYSLVDLINYTTDSYSRYTGNMFTLLSNASNNNDVTITLLPNELENNGYKFVFYLYDGDTFISAIEKKIIAR